jgi:hypothetical protein
VFAEEERQDDSPPRKPTLLQAAPNRLRKLYVPG